MERLFYLVVIIVMAISGWITAYKARRRAKRALGRKVSDAELVSLNTWIEVTKVEEKENGHMTSWSGH